MLLQSRTNEESSLSSYTFIKVITIVSLILAEIAADKIKHNFSDFISRNKNQ